MCFTILSFWVALSIFFIKGKKYVYVYIHINTGDYSNLRRPLKVTWGPKIQCFQVLLEWRCFATSSAMYFPWIFSCSKVTRYLKRPASHHFGWFHPFAWTGTASSATSLLKRCSMRKIDPQSAFGWLDDWSASASSRAHHPSQFMGILVPHGYVCVYI